MLVPLRVSFSFVTLPGFGGPEAWNDATVIVLRGSPYCSTIATIVRRPAGPACGVKRSLPVALLVVVSRCRTLLPYSANWTFWSAILRTFQLSVRREPLP